VSYIVCIRCSTSFSDQQWIDGEVKNYAAQKAWVCANCEIEIVDEWLTAKESQ